LTEDSWDRILPVGRSVSGSVSGSVGRFVLRYCIIQGHESVAFGDECFHFSNAFITFHYITGGTFPAVFLLFFSCAMLRT
jgi:hypothetical protein